MSFPVTSTTGLRVTGLNIAASNWVNGCFIGVWGKCAAGWQRPLCIQGDADAGRPRMALGIDSTLTPNNIVHQAGGSNDSIFSGAAISSDTWTLLGAVWEQDADLHVYRGSNVSTNAGTIVTAFDGDPIKTISVGVQWLQEDGSTNQFGDASGKFALPFIAKRPPTTGASSELEDLAGGAHPLAVFGSDLLDYWPPNSKTSAINGWVFSDVGGSITVDTGDNPTVDDPPAGPSITLAHVERGRTLTRGLARGLS